jgi:hypothetical protein
MASTTRYHPAQARGGARAARRWRRAGSGGLAARQVAAGARVVDRGKKEIDARGERDLGFWVKFDGVYVAHEFKLRTWVLTFLI